MLHILALATQLACAHVTVRQDDTLENIASMHGKTWRYVWRENPFIKNPDIIYPGQHLTICDASLDIVSQSHENTTYTPVIHSVMHNQPCQSTLMFPNTSIHLWETPISCYSGIYYVGKGDCFGWVRYLMGVPRFASTIPLPGDAVHIPPGVQGAGISGHWAYILSIKGQWALISEENMYWRGGGYNKVSYRYLLLQQGMLYYR